MKAKPKILVIENSVEITGALKSIVRSSLDLSNDFDFSFVIPASATVRVFLENQGFENIHSLNMIEISRRPLDILMYLPRLIRNSFLLKKILKKDGIQIIHVNDIYNLLPMGIRLTGMTTPYVCHIRFMPDKFPPLLFKTWLNVHLRFASRMIAVSDAVHAKLPVSEKIIVIKNELPSKEVYQNEAPSQSAGPRFLYLANYIEGKGQNFALEAFGRIHHVIPAWKLRFVGSDFGRSKNKLFRQRLEESAIRMGISEKIEWRGFTDDVEKEYKQADIVLNFSESESFSMTCLEALYYGRPLIASNSGGPAEIVDDGINGLLVANRNIHDMAEAMLLLANDSLRRKKFGQVGKESVTKKFSLENTSLLLKHEYERALSNQ